jgi:hypothetical protein
MSQSLSMTPAAIAGVQPSGAVDSDEIIGGNMQSARGGKGFELLREGVGQPRKPLRELANRAVHPLDARSAYRGEIVYPPNPPLE